MPIVQNSQGSRARQKVSLGPRLRDRESVKPARRRPWKFGDELGPSQATSSVHRHDGCAALYAKVCAKNGVVQTTNGTARRFRCVILSPTQRRSENDAVMGKFRLSVSGTPKIESRRGRRLDRIGWDASEVAMHVKDKVPAVIAGTENAQLSRCAARAVKNSADRQIFSQAAARLRQRTRPIVTVRRTRNGPE